MTARERAEAIVRQYASVTVETLVDDIERALLDTIEETSSKPWLGNATTRELFEELMARVGTADLEYKTTETDEERKKRFSLQTQDVAEIRKMGECK